MECLERINWICIVEYEIIVSVFVCFGFRRLFWNGFRGVTVFKRLLPRGCVFTVIFLFLNTVFRNPVACLSECFECSQMLEHPPIYCERDLSPDRGSASSATRSHELSAMTGHGRSRALPPPPCQRVLRSRRRHVLRRSSHFRRPDVRASQVVHVPCMPWPLWPWPSIPLLEGSRTSLFLVRGPSIFFIFLNKLFDEKQPWK